MKKFFQIYFAALIFALGLSVSGTLAQTSPGNFPNINIRNFGQMDTNYYRGAQPRPEDYQALKALGIDTFIDLQKTPTKYERSTVESMGMRYINIPMEDDVYPPQSAIDRFLEEINDPANGVMYVHCKGGKHRTGVTGAAYRITKYGWDYDKAMREMENYNFDTSWGREVMKTFVQDYAAKMKNGSVAAAK